MSVPSHDIGCTNCQHRSYISSQPNKFILVHDGIVIEKINSEFSLKYCKTCDEIQNIFLAEPLKSWKHTHAEENIISLLKQCNKKGLIYFFKNKRIKKQLETAQKDLDYYKKSYDNSKKFWSEVKASPRCIKCAKNNIDWTDFEYPNYYSRQVLTTKIKHQCGGYITIKEGLHISHDTILFIYHTAEGLKIREEEHYL